MKVGTDGTLLGAWTQGGRRVLDIGTGTGLIALMMAQRYAEAEIVAIDIDPAAVAQAADNVAKSPFASRVNTALCDVRLMADDCGFDAIVVNPPYYDQSLESPDSKRTLARHTSTLSYRELMTAAWRLLTDDGQLSVVIPQECRNKLESEAVMAGFFLVRECGVKTTPYKSIRRYLLAFAKHPTAAIERSEGVLQTIDGRRSPWYDALTKDFYLW